MFENLCYTHTHARAHTQTHTHTHTHTQLLIDQWTSLAALSLSALAPRTFSNQSQVHTHIHAHTLSYKYS
jgi:hypothetical protein